MQDKKSFIMYVNYSNQFRMLSVEQRGVLISAIFDYVETGETIIPMNKTTALAFSFIKDTLDRDALAYQAVCERNAANGRLGGRPKKSAENPTKPKKADNDNANGNKIDNHIYNEIDNKSADAEEWFEKKCKKIFGENSGDIPQ